ncbi:hypothetical protein KCP77_08305 [Salmonella enterica subsp. enterica]|nr:hypothetical protein KCP77_08305 [Salmonella enterica subsp. enterica]
MDTFSRANAPTNPEPILRHSVLQNAAGWSAGCARYRCTPVERIENRVRLSPHSGRGTPSRNFKSDHPMVQVRELFDYPTNWHLMASIIRLMRMK